MADIRSRAEALGIAYHSERAPIEEVLQETLESLEFSRLSESPTRQSSPSLEVSAIQRVTTPVNPWRADLVPGAFPTSRLDTSELTDLESRFASPIFAKQENRSDSQDSFELQNTILERSDTEEDDLNMSSLSDRDLDRIVAKLATGLRGDIIEHFTSDPQLVDRLRGPPGPPGESSSSFNSGGGENIKARDIGFFWPDCPVSDNLPEGPTAVATNGDVMYRSHARFFGRLDDVLATYPYDKVKVQLIQCLRGMAQDWYANELDELDRQGIRDDSSRTFKVFKARCASRFAKTSLEAN